MEMIDILLSPPRPHPREKRPYAVAASPEMEVGDNWREREWPLKVCRTDKCNKCGTVTALCLVIVRNVGGGGLEDGQSDS